MPSHLTHPGSCTLFTFIQIIAYGGPAVRPYLVPLAPRPTRIRDVEYDTVTDLMTWGLVTLGLTETVTIIGIQYPEHM